MSILCVYDAQPDSRWKHGVAVRMVKFADPALRSIVPEAMNSKVTSAVSSLGDTRYRRLLFLVFDIFSRCLCHLRRDVA